MNNLTKTLLGSVALAALGAAPAMAEQKHPAFSFTAVHAGRVVNKTKLHNRGAVHLTYTFSVYGTADVELDKKVLVGSFYKWNSNSTVCSTPKMKLKLDPKKTVYGKISVATQTYSLGCPSGPTVYYGVAYKLTNPDGIGETDHFKSSLIGKFKNAHGKYKGTLNSIYSLTLE